MARHKRTTTPMTEKQYKKQLRAARWLAAHREQNRLSCAAYRLENLDECRAKDRGYYAAHRAARIADVIARDKARPAVCRAREARWRKAHPEYQQVKDARRNARKRGAAIVDFTVTQWVAMQAMYDHRCVYCGKRFKGKLTQDHLTPFARGGNHTASNIVPACRSCNGRKSDGPVLIPVQPLLFVA